MFYSIENKLLKVSVETLGAQLKSVWSKRTETEYLWQRSPEYWKGSAPNLFPYIGRNFGGSYFYGDEEYAMTIHGVAKTREFKLVSRSATRLTFLLEEDETSLKEYPFRFRFYIVYELEGEKLKTTYQVENTDEKTLIFALGGHPGFNVPFGEQGVFEDYYLEFAEKSNVCQLTCSENKFMSGKRIPFALEEGVKLPLKHELFDNDAIILGSTCRRVHLKSKATSRYITVEYPDFKYLGIWQTATPDTPFVCIEPWSALPATEGKKDVLENKADMYRLPAGKSYETVWTISINE
ncbi:MAG: aldose 1-epimerase family protein [Clostridia bacterium]|nr:aldose 1-epimerase family protein [Clostridia bacterium]